MGFTNSPSPTLAPQCLLALCLTRQGAHGTGDQQAGRSLQYGGHICLCRSACSVSLSLLGVCLVFQHLCNTVVPSAGALPSVPHSLSWSLCGISFPGQENAGIEQKLNLLKAVPCSHGNTYPDPYEIICWRPAASCPKFKHRKHNSKVWWCMDVTWNHLEQRSWMQNLCLAQGRARGLLAIVYCCLSTRTQAYQNVFAGLLRLPCTAFNSSFGDLCILCELSCNRRCSTRGCGESLARARLLQSLAGARSPQRCLCRHAGCSPCPQAQG